MASVFTKIIDGEIPSYKVAEDSDFIAILDVNPLSKGHVLVVSKIEEDYFFDLDDTLLGAMMVFSKKIATAIKVAIPCKKVGVAVVGLEVPHCHVHLCPMNDVSDMNFSLPKKTFTKEEFESIASLIASALV